ncbi:MAG: TPM domain-containing protein [Lachnospiraceae bacterium]|nr:TPM domain-containing protein [Lachnospiraceae bacterium]
MKDLGASLKQYLRHFIVGFIIVLALVGVFLFFYIREKNKPKNYYDSPNTERVYGDQRVFDYADQLTKEQEDDLEAFIRDAEKQTCLDIVIVTLNETLADYETEYRAKYDIPVTPDKYVMVYADKFWEDSRFGYNCPQVLDGTTNSGDGVILVDNLFREPETGQIHTWMGTTGKAEVYYSDYLIDYRLDDFYEYVNDDYLKACKYWVDGIKRDMRVDYDVSEYVSYPDGMFGIILLIIAGIAALIYFGCNASERAGKNTTTKVTYLAAEPVFPLMTDTFTHKDVRKVYNPPSESSRSGGGGGGGGHHSSGGGGSHGGGGHSR